MNLLAAKIYYDGSHWIAIPHTERPYRQRRRRKRPEKSGELQQFEERFEKVKGGRKSRKAKLLQEFTSMFKDEDEAEQFRGRTLQQAEPQPLGAVQTNDPARLYQ